MGRFTVHTFVLARIRIFTLKDLWLFLIGVMFVSTTSGAIAAFIMGVSEEEFFIDEVDNILIVTEPGSTTPLTSRVPDYVQADIQKVNGVFAISRETMCVSIAQNLDDRSIIVRGVTPNFLQITRTKLIEGSWFNPEFDQSANIHVSNGAMVGFILAEGLGLECGDKLQLASTVTDVVMELVITGIIQSDSPIDEELLVTLSVGKILAKKEDTFVSFIRVLVNEEIITKEKLSELLNEVFSVKIMLSTQDPKLAGTLVGTPIIAYTPNGAYVETKTIQDDNVTEFELKFGSYEFVATPSGIQNSPTLSVFLNQNFSDPFEIQIGASYYDLQFNITYNREPAKNASVFLQDKFHHTNKYTSQTNSEGLAQFHSISEDFYEISINYREIEENSTVRLTESMRLNIELENSLSLTILNVTSNEEVHGGTVRILNTSALINNYQSGNPIYLEYPGEYMFEFELDRTFRDFPFVVKGIVNHTIYVGTAPLVVWTRGNNRIPLESTNVSITRFNEFIGQASTDINGLCEFQLETGLYYNVTAVPTENQSKAQMWEFLFFNESTFIIDFLDLYSLDVSVINGTALNNSDNGLVDCDIVIFKNATQI
ncbi:MAG: ABC transporter permease, partial [Candidatus Hodarchaeota archaeon]